MPPKSNITNAIREECRAAFKEATKEIAKIATGTVPDVTNAAQIRAYESLGKYGVGAQASLVVQKAEYLRLVAEVTSKYIKGEAYQQWWQSVEATFNSIP